MKKTILAAAAAMVGWAASAHASQITISFDVPRGACKVLAQPINDKPVHMMGTTIVPLEDRGEGEVVLQRSGRGASLFLDWAGVDYVTGFTHGFGFAADGGGAHIMYLDLGGYVDVQTARSSKVEVCNTIQNPGHAVGYLTFLY
jgi:hypothetical protein